MLTSFRSTTVQGRRAKVLVLLVAVLGLFVFTAATVPSLSWRVQLIGFKATGALPDLSWSDIFRWLGPGSSVWLGDVAATRNPYISIHNPDDSSHAVREGAALFARHCAQCHGADGRGATGPTLRKGGGAIGRSDWALFRTIRQGLPRTAMPEHAFPETDLWRLVAFTKSLATQSERTPHTSGEKARRFIHAPYSRLLSAEKEPANWLTYSGRYFGWRHSALTEVAVDNIARLALAWAMPISDGRERVQTSPIVVDGVMFVTEPPSNVIAIDANTGETLWKYTRQVPDDVQSGNGRVNRGVTILDDIVYLATLDAHLVALSANTGAVQWDVTVANYHEGYTMTGTPLALRDRVLVGVAGGEYGVRGLIDAYDAGTGTRLWRFNTVPGPGEPGHDTWSGNSWMTGGAATWLGGSFDPGLNMVFWGTGNPAPVYNGSLRNGDNLFSNSVVALDAEAGKLRWHFQFTPHDQHDWDSAQIPVLVDREIDGTVQKLMLWANKNGFYYVLNRETGKYLHSEAFVAQNWADGMDKDGRPRVRGESTPTSKGTVVRPGASGGTSWWPPSYSPATDMLYVPVLEQSAVFIRGEPELRTDGMLLGGASVPDPQYQNAIRALEPMTGSRRWEYRFVGDVAAVSGVLSTAGNVLFVGHGRRFYALDASNGRQVWSVNLGNNISAPPVSFMAGGRQMVTVATSRMLFTFALGQPEASAHQNSMTLVPRK